MLLQGRRALITGASSGIGKATAVRMGQEGAAVAVNYYSDAEAGDAQAVVDTVIQAGGRGLAVQADVGNEQSVVAMVQRVISELGGLDLLVNNAGIEKQMPLVEMDLHTWNAILTTNPT